MNLKCRLNVSQLITYRSLIHCYEASIFARITKASNNLIVASQNLFNIGSGNGLLPGGTMQLPEAMSSINQRVIYNENTYSGTNMNKTHQNLKRKYDSWNVPYILHNPFGNADHYSDVIKNTTASQITVISMFAQPFVRADIKEKNKVPRRWPLWGESKSNQIKSSLFLISTEMIFIQIQHVYTYERSTRKAGAYQAGCLVKVTGGFRSQSDSSLKMFLFNDIIMHSPANLSHRCRDKMAKILQTTFSNAFSWMKMILSWLTFT